VSRRRILALGASAGGLAPLCRIVAALPSDLAVAVFVCQHVSPSSPSALPHILARSGPFRCLHPADGQEIENGTVYVAQPDFHLLIEEDVVRLARGPEENRFRPSIDTMFRSAAQAHGPNVVAAVLTGQLSDGAVGLQAVKKCGGIAVVQDPKDAEHPSMPSHAMQMVQVDHCVSMNDMPALLVRLLKVPPVPTTAIREIIVAGAATKQSSK
jgi:two-component system chemotaxis response regulator CheB